MRYIPNKCNNQGLNQLMANQQSKFTFNDSQKFVGTSYSVI